ncbi:MAG: DNA polymerase III subunit epsilon [Halioglobus sp.]|nr:DNA polymerase III subunit epsilon [Halioglobus sp.]MCB1709842.1 DNA polymerase III subunit epsilon [Halioglobus sp.]MCP5122259.1 DNA polymerase III subunit epsilon [Pseudomonadales bacterium]MCP5192196.1 DNA polymerase III subunit epsilon [Pseudomonadales bacterium]
MRQIVLDTETTGLEASQGHRIIEIGCVELINRRLTGNHYHQYINPQREIDQGAIEVHGITSEFLTDKPLFAQVAADFVDFISGAELIIHNAPFDLGFLDAELQRLPTQYGAVRELCAVIDTLVMARAKHPGQRNNLDALCQRYDVDNSQRDLHGALLDAEILADVYLAMTGGQTTFQLSDASANSGDGGPGSQQIRRLATGRAALPVIAATPAERSAHEAQLDAIAASSGGRVLWRELAERGLA